jgi:hypothetical protein
MAWDSVTDVFTFSRSGAVFLSLPCDLFWYSMHAVVLIRRGEKIRRTAEINSRRGDVLSSDLFVGIAKARP